MLDLINKLPISYQIALPFISASFWLTALPLSEDGYTLHNWAFRDALCLRYGWPPIGAGPIGLKGYSPSTFKQSYRLGPPNFYNRM